MLIILETGQAEAADNLRNCITQSRLPADAGVGHFSRRLIPLIRRRLRCHILPPNIQQIMVANLIRDMVTDGNLGGPWARQGMSNADNP